MTFAFIRAPLTAIGLANAESEPWCVSMDQTDGFWRRDSQGHQSSGTRSMDDPRSPYRIKKSSHVGSRDWFRLEWDGVTIIIKKVFT